MKHDRESLHAVARTQIPHTGYMNIIHSLLTIARLKHSVVGLDGHRTSTNNVMIESHNKSPRAPPRARSPRTHVGVCIWGAYVHDFYCPTTIFLS